MRGCALTDFGTRHCSLHGGRRDCAIALAQDAATRSRRGSLPRDSSRYSYQSQWASHRVRGRSGSINQRDCVQLVAEPREVRRPGCAGMLATRVRARASRSQGCGIIHSRVLRRHDGALWASQGQSYCTARPSAALTCKYVTVTDSPRTRNIVWFLVACGDLLPVIVLQRTD